MTDNADYPSPLLKPRRGLSLVWLVPLVTLAIALWLLWQGVLGRGQTVDIQFANGEGIVAGQTELRYKGIRVGIVRTLQVLPDLTGVRAEVEFERGLGDHIPEDSQFWLVQPQVSATGISGLNTLFTGNYIAMQPGDSENGGGSFTALREPPALPQTEPGLHLELRADRLGSLSPGAPILYKQISIGSVQSFAMSEDNQNVRIRVHILPEFSHLVRKNTRFWNASGVQLNAGLSGVKLRTESLATLLAGGIAISGLDEQSPSAANGDRFTLFPDFEAAEVAVRIRVRFSSAQGLSNTTKVMYKGMQVGRVLWTWYDRKEDKIVAEVGLSPLAEPYVNERSRFFLVQPQVSLAGISGLDALFSGSYIALEAGEGGQPRQDFVAADGPSAGDFREPGLHLTLTASAAAGLQRGSPVYHRQLPVGEVENVSLAGDGRSVRIQLVVKPEYSHLLNSRSRFWNVSGVSVEAGLGGVQVRSESLATLLGGGIAFDTPEDPHATPLQNGHTFALHTSETAALGEVEAELRLPSADGLIAGQTRVVYRGMTLGVVKQVKLDDKGQEVRATVGFTREASPLLKRGTRFWLVRPQISAAGVKGLDALLSGPYLTLRPGDGDEARRFTVQEGAPAVDTRAPGLHLVLTAPEAGSLSPGAPLLFRQLPAGQVQEVQLGRDGQVEIHLHVLPRFARHVNSRTRFWNASGITVSGGLGGLKVRTESAAALLSGGIGFDAAEGGEPVRNGDRFTLFSDAEAARQAGITLQLTLDSAADIAVGAPIRYRGLDVGRVTSLRLAPDLGGIVADASLREEARPLAREGSHLHLRTARIGLARTENAGAALTGAFLELVPGAGAPRFHFAVQRSDPLEQRRSEGLNLVLEAPLLGSLRAGDPVTYRQLKVGEVLGTTLSPDARQVRVFVNIWPGHERLVRDNTVFWRTSGVQVEAGLFKGVEVRTESAETILSGGITFATPEPAAPRALEGHAFPLAEAPAKHWQEWAPAL